MRVYRITEESLQDRFARSKAKVQVFGGGFANGKTAAACVKALRLAQQYPGGNGLIARATYPKLNDTIRKEFFKWCPKRWIKSWSKSDNTLELVNGTIINFRYIAQQNRDENSTSNLLSATYDWIVVDQVEDPEIVEKDFLDLLGRLRGMARYIGDDPAMPASGPRWIMLTCNPTSNWVYRKLVKPLHLYSRTGEKSPDLLVDGKTGEPLVELFEGSTYENQENLEPDFIATLETTYRGQMRDRFLMGMWSSYEGLVYSQFDPEVHQLPHKDVLRYFNRLKLMGFDLTILEGYDHGLAVPSCYMIGFADDDHNVFMLDGLYEAGLSVEALSRKIEDIRREYGYEGGSVLADPQVFRRTTGDKRTVGVAVNDLFRECGISMRRGNNDILNGIIKIQSYLNVSKFHRHPIYGTAGAPKLYISGRCEFLTTEFGEYRWKKDGQSDVTDTPVDKNDHGLDTLKYMLSDVPSLAKVGVDPTEIPAYMYWQEHESRQTEQVKARHR